MSRPNTTGRHKNQKNFTMPENRVLNVCDGVFWIGVFDRDIVTFDVVMETKYGTTYNSYFINAEKKTIVETVKEKFWDTYLEKIQSVVDPAEIEYIVVNHTEPDHSGCLAKLLEIAPKAKVVGSGNAIRYLRDLLGYEIPHLVVRDGQTLDLGDRVLQFVGASNLHWPDSMMTYLQEDKLLFTCDIFGEHYCNEGVFDDMVGDFDEAFRYYYDVIMKPYSKFMLQAIERIRPLEINAILPGHGAVLRRDWKKYVDLSEQYALEALKGQKPNRIFLGYVSAYQNTGIIAGLIARGIQETGDLEVDLCDLEHMDPSAVEQKIAQASGIVLGCPTFSQNILLPVYQVFAVINPIRDRNKPAAAFGSYGWSGEGARIITSALSSLKLKVMDEGLMVKFTPHRGVEEKCVEYGRKFGRMMLAGQTVTAEPE
jgi:flavorubredoxin